MLVEKNYMGKNTNGLFLDCENSQQAWEQLNEYILLNEVELKEKGAGRDGNASISYDNLIYIRKAWVDPEFDFGRMFGYKIQKWSHLVNNYVDLNYLDILKTEIQTREAKKQRNYQITKHFSNTHDNGKDCLISLTFSRRINNDVPVLVFHTRATEVTKRLLIDFLLIQRMGEYVYGDKTFSIVMYCPMAYLSIEAFTMYHTHRSLFKLLSRPKLNRGVWKSNLEPMQQRVIETLEKYLTIDPMKISYKSHRRAVKQLQTDDNGMAISGTPPMKAKQLQLETKSLIQFPDDVITDRQRKDYKKKLRNKNKV